MSLSLKNLYNSGPIIDPVIPVKIIATTVTAGSPPICFETVIPMGVVIDLGNNDFIKSEGL